MSQIKTIGIVGGGQLGRMLTQAAVELGFQVVVVNPSNNSPASQVGASEIIGDLYDNTALDKLGKSCDVITVEIEHMDANALEHLAKNGKKVHPSPQTIKLIQDKFLQKEYLAKAKIPVAEFCKINTLEQAKAVLKKFNGKMLVKTRHGAYDGRGNALVSSVNDLNEAWKQFEGKKLYAESFVPFIKEIAVMVARSAKGDIKTYPITETFHERNICIKTLTPAEITPELTVKAELLAKNVAKHMQGAGVFGIEMFLTADGEVLVNEIAPRVHNSGHYTIEACKTSQFEQHIRAIAGMPLGSTELKVPAAVMINILGERDGDTDIDGLETAQAVPNTFVHLYGKSPTKIDRKMGHITSIGKDLNEASTHAQQARESISL